MYACLTCDVEGNPKAWKKQLPKFLHLMSKNQAKMTLFLALDEGISSYISYYRVSSALHSFENMGHEVGLHIHWGSWKVAAEIRSRFKAGVRLCKSYRESLRAFTVDEMTGELKYYLELIKKLGFSPQSFRGGGLCQTTSCLNILAEHGFRVDSSVAAGLNEKGGWHQGHINVPYGKGFYYPTKNRYDLPAKYENERMGILEVPVTRGPPDGSWDSVMTVASFKRIYEWAVSNQEADTKVITLVFHNWEIGETGFKLRTRAKFTSALENIMICLRKQNVRFVTMAELESKVRAEARV